MPSLVFNYGNWQFWGAYAPPLYLGEQKIVFDGPNKLIIVNQDITELDFRIDVYSAWKEWVIDPNQTNSKYVSAVTAIGGDDLPGSRVLGTTYFLENGWRMRTWEGDHSLTVTGNVFTRQGEPIFVPTINPWTITINLNTSTLVETILPEIALTQADINAIVAGTVDEVPAAVWNQTIQGSNTAIDVLLSLPDNVWDYIVEQNLNQSAKQRLLKIATKVQDIALS
jgi:hypothetical protein